MILRIDTASLLGKVLPSTRHLLLPASIIMKEVPPLFMKSLFLPLQLVTTMRQIPLVERWSIFLLLM